MTENKTIGQILRANKFLIGHRTTKNVIDSK